MKAKWMTEVGMAKANFAPIQVILKTCTEDKDTEAIYRSLGKMTSL